MSDLYNRIVWGLKAETVDGLVSVTVTASYGGLLAWYTLGNLQMTEKEALDLSYIRDMKTLLTREIEKRLT